MTALNVRSFGADETGKSDSTDALRAAFLSIQKAGGGSLVLKGRFKIDLPEGEALAIFKGIKGIYIDARDAILDNSRVSYVSDKLSPIFLFDSCQSVEVLLNQYIGFTLPTPEKHLGYRGATLIRAINGCKTMRIRVENASNLRYGFQTGEYGNPSRGSCSNLDVTIKGSMIGYAIATYLADEILFFVDVDGIHRAAYFAGSSTIRGVAKWRDQYVTDTALLITDALLSGSDKAAESDPEGSPTSSRGCQNLAVESIDKGSTIFQPSSSCAGISLSRVDPCTFKNIVVKVFSKGTDKISTTVGGWRLISRANTVWKRYSDNWTPNIVIEGLSISGTIDHSECTLAGNISSEFYVKGFDKSPAGGATFRDLSFDGFTFLPSKGQKRGSIFHAPGLRGHASFRGFRTPGVALNILTNSENDSLLENCEIGELNINSGSGASRVVIGQGCAIGKQTSP